MGNQTRKISMRHKSRKWKMLTILGSICQDPHANVCVLNRLLNTKLFAIYTY